MKANFQGIGWEVLLRNKGSNYFLTLMKEVVIGNGLKKGDPLQYFLVKHQGRNGILILLDGKGIDGVNKTKLGMNTFLVKKR